MPIDQIPTSLLPLKPRSPSVAREARSAGAQDSPGDGWIAFASVGKPHGLKGGFFLHTEDRRTEWDGYVRLRIEVEGGFAPCKALKAYASGGALALVLDVLPTREAVVAFQGARLFVHRDEIPLKEDEILTGDLTGLRVIDEEGTERGVVQGVVSFGAQDNLVIRVPGRKDEVLFPYVDAFVLSVDSAAGIVRIRYEATFFEGQE